MSGVAIEGIIYDWDGLLVDTEDIWFQGCQQVCAEFGVEITEEHRLDLMRSDLSVYLVDRFRLPITADELRPTLYQFVDEALEDDIPLLPGARQSIDILGPRYPLAIGTGSRTSQVETCLTRLGLRDRFAVVVGADQVENGKPAPDIYLKAAEALGLAPESCVALEDQPKGIQSAKAAGMTCIVVPNKSLPNADYSQADRIIPNLGHISLALIAEIESSRL